MKRLGIPLTFLLALVLATGSTPSYHPPTKAVAFGGVLLDGGSFNFNNYLGSTPVILNFWALWGEPCNKEAELLEKIHRSYGDRLAVIGVNVQDFEENARAFAIEHNISYPIVLDGTADIAWIYQVKHLPTTFFIDSSGRIVAIHRGPLKAGQLDRYIKLLLETQVSGEN